MSSPIPLFLSATDCWTIDTAMILNRLSRRSFFVDAPKCGVLARRMIAEAESFNARLSPTSAK